MSESMHSVGGVKYGIQVDIKESSAQMVRDLASSLRDLGSAGGDLSGKIGEVQKFAIAANSIKISKSSVSNITSLLNALKDAGSGSLDLSKLTSALQVMSTIGSTTASTVKSSTQSAKRDLDALYKHSQDLHKQYVASMNATMSAGQGALSARAKVSDIKSRRGQMLPDEFRAQMKQAQIELQQAKNVWKAFQQQTAAIAKQKQSVDASIERAESTVRERRVKREESAKEKANKDRKKEAADKASEQKREEDAEVEASIRRNNKKEALRQAQYARDAATRKKFLSNEMSELETFARNIQSKIPAGYQAAFKRGMETLRGQSKAGLSQSDLSNFADSKEIFMRKAKALAKAQEEADKKAQATVDQRKGAEEKKKADRKKDEDEAAMRAAMYDTKKNLEEKQRANFEEVVSGKNAATSFFLGLGLQRMLEPLKELIKESTLVAARVNVLGTVLDNVAVNAGYSTSEMNAFETRIESLGITTQAARQSLALLARNELDVAKGAKLARVAQDSAVIAGENSSESFEKLVIASQRLDTRLARQRGLLINLRHEYQMYALATGRSEANLTAFEKQQIFLNALLRQGATIMGTYEAAMQDVGKQFYSLDRYVEQAQLALGQMFQPMFEKYVKSITNVLDWFAKEDGAGTTFQAFTATIIATGYAAAKSAEYFLFFQSALSGYLLLAKAAKGINIAETIGSQGFGKFVTMLASIKLWHVVAVTAAVAALAVGISSWSAALEILREKELKDAASRGANIASLEYQINKYEKIKKTGDGTYISQERIRLAFLDLREAAAALHPELKNVSDAEELLTQIGNKIPQVTNIQKYLDGLRTQLKLVNEDLEEANKKIRAQETLRGSGTNTYGIGPGGAAPIYTGDAEKLEQRKNKLKNEIDAYYNTRSTHDLRALEERSKLMETSYQLALQGEKKLKTLQDNRTTGTSAKLFAEYREFVDETKRSYMTPDQLAEKNSIETMQKLNQRRLTYEKQLKNAGSDKKKRDEITAEYESSVLDIRSQQVAELVTAFNMQQKILEVSRQQNFVLDSQLKTYKQQIDLQRESLNMKVGGVPEDVINGRKELFDLMNKMNDEQQRHDKIVGGDPERAARLGDRLKASRADFEVIRAREKSFIKEKEDNEGKLTETEEKALAIKISDTQKLLELKAAEIASLELEKQSAEKGIKGMITYYKTFIDKQSEISVLEEQLTNKMKTHSEDVRQYIENIRKAMDTLASSFRNAYEQAIDADIQFTTENRKLAEERDALMGKEIRNYEKLRSEFEETRNAVQQGYEEVAKFNREQEISFADRMAPGFKQLQEIIDNYVNVVKQAGDQQQLDQLGINFRRALSEPLQETNKELREAWQQYNKLRREFDAARYSGDAGKVSSTLQEEAAQRQKILELQTKMSNQTGWVADAGRTFNDELRKQEVRIAKLNRAYQERFANMTPEQQQAERERIARLEEEKNMTPMEKQARALREIQPLLNEELRLHDLQKAKLDEVNERHRATREYLIGNRDQFLQIARTIEQDIIPAIDRMNKELAGGNFAGIIAGIAGILGGANVPAPKGVNVPQAPAPVVKNAQPNTNVPAGAAHAGVGEGAGPEAPKSFTNLHQSDDGMMVAEGNDGGWWVVKKQGDGSLVPTASWAQGEAGLERNGFKPIGGQGGAAAPVNPNSPEAMLDDIDEFERQKKELVGGFDDRRGAQGGANDFDANGEYSNVLEDPRDGSRMAFSEKEKLWYKLRKDASGKHWMRHASFGGDTTAESLIGQGFRPIEKDKGGQGGGPVQDVDPGNFALTREPDVGPAGGGVMIPTFTNTTNSLIDKGYEKNVISRLNNQYREQFAPLPMFMRQNNLEQERTDLKNNYQDEMLRRRLAFGATRQRGVMPQFDDNAVRNLLKPQQAGVAGPKPPGAEGLPPAVDAAAGAGDQAMNNAQQTIGNSVNKLGQLAKSWGTFANGVDEENKKVEQILVV